MDEALLQSEIEKVAYDLYLKSGGLEGRDLDNWLEAEESVHACYNNGQKRNNIKKTSRQRRRSHQQA